jgi:hypothetical protein
MTIPAAPTSAALIASPTLALDLAAARGVLEEMRDTDAQWQRELATFTDADGDVDPQHYPDYEKAKLDHGWDLIGSLTDWVARLTTALGVGAQDAP